MRCDTHQSRNVCKVVSNQRGDGAEREASMEVKRCYGRWLVLDDDSVILWWVDKDGRGMNLYPRKQHLKWHEDIKEHTGLCQKIGIVRKQDER